MNTKSILAALMMGTAIVASNVSHAAEKEAKGAAKTEAKAKDAKATDAKATEATAESKGADAKAGEAKPAAAAAGSSVKLTKPWSDIASLTDEQKVKIDAAHKKALAEINAIEKREKEEITALLTDAQRAELKDAADKKKKEAAAKRAAEKKAEAK